MSNYKTGCEIPTHKVTQDGVHWSYYASIGQWVGAPDLGAHYDLSQRPVKAAASTGTNWATAAVPIVQQLVGNGAVGDCVEAGFVKGILTTQANESAKVVTPDDNDGILLYSQTSGYVPGKPNTDNGSIPTVVAKYLQTTGATIQGANYMIDAYASIDPTRIDIIQAAIEDFGGVQLVVVLPDSWAAAEGDGHIFPLPTPSDQIDGGHQMFAPDWVSAGTKPPLFSNPVAAGEDGLIVNLWPRLMLLPWTTFLNAKIGGSKVVDSVLVILPQDW